MKLTFLGTGGAFTTNNWQSNLILEVNGKRLLIDAGSDVRHSLKEQGLSSKDIDAVYISHLHGDHAGGMEYIALTRYDWVNHSKPTVPLYLHHSLTEPLWETMKGACGTVQNRVTNLESFFQVNEVPDNGTFTFEGVELRLVQTVHFVNGFYIQPSFGLIWETKKHTKVFLTTDTQFAPNQIMDYYKSADLVFHDCETYDMTGKLKSGVHAHYLDLKTLPEGIRKRFWLYHYADGKLPDAKADGFAGFAQKGQAFDLDLAASMIRGNTASA